jgi:hypothetical protein
MMGLQRMQYIMLLTYLLTKINNDSEDYLTSENDILFQTFISSIKDGLLTHKKIFTLTFFPPEFLPSDRKEIYTSHRLQHKLERHVVDLITIAFESANDSTSVPIGKLRKYLSLAECIVSVSKNNLLLSIWGSYYRCFGSLCALPSTYAAHIRAVGMHGDCIW